MTAYVKVGSDLSGSLLYTVETVTLRDVRRVKTLAVIVNAQIQAPIVKGHGDLDM